MANISSVNVVSNFRPFTTTVRSEANLGINELVLESVSSVRNICQVCEFDAVVDLVERNTTLEILETGASITQLRNTIPRGFGKALGCNRALKEIRFRLGSAVDFKELVLLLVPDANGHQANTTLSTLELSLVSFYASPLDYMTDLAKLVASYSTLTDVRISRELAYIYDPALRKFFIQKTMVEVSKLRGELERMADKTQACGL